MSGALVLVGLSGSGKSTIGRVLATRLGMPLLDTDRLIEDTAAASVADIFERRGEEVFRDLEQAAVADACGRAAVVATGGGAVLRPANRRAMRRGNLVVWLDAPVAMLARRLATHTDGEERPLLRGDTEQRLRVLWRERRPLYAASAHVRAGVGDQAQAGVHDTPKRLAAIYLAWRGMEVRS